MNPIVSAVPSAGAASESAGSSQTTAVHWREQSARSEDRAHMGQLLNTQPAQQIQQTQQAAVSAQSNASVRVDLRPSATSGTDVLGRAELFAALDKLRNTPAERMPVAAAELMVKCYEYQFNVAAVTHAAKNVEESVQTMTTRT